ncbi:hypothetical protein [Burkholderia ubonensis]|nr:hypothetical protein [Burkholderia ubonensis]
MSDQLGCFDANGSAECIPQVQQIADDHALTLLLRIPVNVTADSGAT